MILHVLRSNELSLHYTQTEFLPCLACNLGKKNVDSAQIALIKEENRIWENESKVSRKLFKDLEKDMECLNSELNNTKFE